MSGQVSELSGICQNCRFAEHGDYNARMSRRPLIIVILLLACLGLIGVLGWQSWQLQQSNDAVARSVQRDYANLAADEYGRRLTAALGYRGYFQVISRIDDPTDAATLRAALLQDPQLGDAALLVGGVFVAEQDEISIDGITPTPELQTLLASIATADVDPDGPYQTVVVAADRPQVVYTRSEDGNRIFGFTANPAGVEKFLRAALDQAPLLPASLGDGNVGNDKLFVEVVDGTGHVLMVANSLFPYPQLVETVMGDDYQGVVENFRIRVAVDPAIASTLVIGGLPMDRLPLLALVMTLAVALLLAAMWLFRREQAVTQLRIDFVSQVSHELRTPLTQIRMFAETLLLERTRSVDEQRRALEIIDRESRRLSHLVENILQFSSIADGASLSPELQPITPVIREVCEATEMTNASVNIELQAAEPVTAVFDDDALRQILLNVLDNAVKYGPKNQTITVQLSEAQDLVRIEVIDEGPGIPKAERERIWEAFHRLEKEQQTAISGTGIGLAVVRELVEGMQGRCWIGEAESGTRVLIELPGNDSDD